MIARRFLHLVGFTIVCVLLVVGLIVGAQGLPFGIGMVVVGMLGFILGGFANLYLLHVIFRPHVHTCERTEAHALPCQCRCGVLFVLTTP